MPGSDVKAQTGGGGRLHRPAGGMELDGGRARYQKMILVRYGTNRR